MIQIRRNVFETNSSSTHNCTVMNDSEYCSFQEGDLYLNNSWTHTESKVAKKELLTREEIVEYLEYTKDYKEVAKKLEEVVNDKEAFEEVLKEENFEDKFISAERFYDEDRLEIEERTYSLPKDTLHIICKFGFDG